MSMVMLSVATCVLAPPQSDGTFTSLAATFLAKSGYVSCDRTQLTSMPFQGTTTWRAQYTSSEGEKLSLIFSEKTGIIHVSNSTTMKHRHDRIRTKRIPTVVLSEQSSKAKLRAKAAKVWGNLEYEEELAYGTFVGRTTPDLAGGASTTCRRVFGGFPAPSSMLRMNIDLETGSLIECTYRIVGPKFPAAAPVQWITRTAAVAAGYPGPPRWIEGDWAELQWFEPNRGATCKLAWRLRRRSREVVVDAVSGAVLDVPLYGGSRPPGG